MTDPLKVALPSTLKWVAPPAVFDPRRPDWQQHGACLASDPDAFFPERGDDVRAAKAICRQCPVRQECLDYALDTRQMFGVWGGTSERERRAMRPRRPKPAPQRERVQEMAARGATAAQIAVELGITPSVVHRHLKAAS